MPENSLQDLRDDWAVGDEVLVEYPGYGGATSSVRSGRIVDKESAFATVRVENGGNQKIAYKRLRPVAKPPRRIPNPQAAQQSLPLPPTVPGLRAVPPALAGLAEALAPAEAAETAEPTPAPAPVEEQKLVKLAPRSPAPRVIPAEPELEAAPVPAPTPVATPKKRKTDNIAAWLENGESILDQLAAKEKGLREEANELEDLRREVEAEAALKLADLEKIRADIESYRKLRKFIATVRPNIPLVQADQHA